MVYAPSIFKVNERYRVKQSFMSGPTSGFIAGEVLTFERPTYSFYDNCFVYEFRTVNNDVKTWWLGEKESVELWRQYFESINPGVGL
jgi:hypothetical protein